jgi:hypothetical protein
MPCPVLNPGLGYARQAVSPAQVIGCFVVVIVVLYTEKKI